MEDCSQYFFRDESFDCLVGRGTFFPSRLKLEFIADKVKAFFFCNHK